MTDTPPPSTLSTPSPTERDPWNQEPPPPAEDKIPPTSVLIDMNTVHTAKPIHLIVATSLSPRLGIGQHGRMPWPSIKADMAFFRRATTGKGSWADSKAHKLNAVVMGRKTYESVPARFRPLADRVNVVLTRGDVRAFADRVLRELTTGKDGEGEPSEYRIVDQGSAGGIAAGLAVSIVRRDETQPLIVVTDTVARALDVDAPEVFCIGGAEIYGLVLRERRRTLRVLQTLVKKTDGSAFECDTFWPEDMEDEKGAWKKVDSAQIEQWMGVKVPQDKEEWLKDDKAGVEIRTVGWERQREES